MHFPDRLAGWIARPWPRLGLTLLLAVLLHFPVASGIGLAPHPPNDAYSDLVLQHWPLVELVRNTLLQHGQLALWNPTVYAGQPLAADPLLAFFYPPQWLLLLPILPLPLGFNLLFLLHVTAAGWFMAGWQLASGRSPWAAGLAAVAFMGLPKLAAHYGAGHYGLSLAFCLTPALLWAVDLARHRLRHAVWVGVGLAAIFMIDVRWAVFAGALIAAYWLIAPWLHSDLNKPNRETFLGIGLAGGVALLLAAPLWLPLLHFVGQSARQGLTLADANRFALTGLDFMGILLPRYGGNHELQTYFGWPLVLLAGVGATQRRWFWLGVVVVAGWWALGAQAGLFALAFDTLPGISLLRVPSRAWFVVGLGVVVLAAYGFDRLLTTPIPRSARFTLNLVNAGLAAAGLGLGLGVLVLIGEISGLFLGVGLVAIGFAVLFQRRWWRLALPLVIIELAVMNGLALTMRPPLPQPELTAVLAAAPGRVYSPSLSVLPLTALQAQVYQLDGVNPLQLRVAVDTITPATGIPRVGYRETIPTFDLPDPMPGATPEELADLPTVANINAGYQPIAQDLAVLGVSHVVSAFEIASADLHLVGQADEQWVYENLAFDGLAHLSTGAALPAQLTPNRITVTNSAGTAGLVIVASFNDGNWQVRQGGGAWQAAGQSPAGLLQAEILAGQTALEIRYWPEPLFIGLGLFLMGVLLVLGSVRWLK